MNNTRNGNEYKLAKVYLLVAPHINNPSRLQNVLQLGKVDGTLLLAQGDLASLLLGQGTAHGSRLLGAQVNRQLLSLSGNLGDQLGAALLAHDGQDAGDGLAGGADGTALGGILATRDGLHTERVQLVLQVGELLLELFVVLGTQFVGLDGRLHGSWVVRMDVQ